MKSRIPSLVLVGAILFAGCGGSDSGGTQTQAERDAAYKQVQIDRLQAKIAEQKKQMAAKQAEAAAAAKQAAAASNGKGEVDTYLAGLPGEAGLVVGSPGGDGPRVSGGDLKTGSAWSTIKVPIAERVLEDFGGPSGISSAQAGKINRAITVSDNDAAAALFSSL